MSLWRNISRRWKYGTTKLEARFNEKADTEIQLQQAIDEAKAQHKRLQEQATAMITNQKQTEMQLSRTRAALERENSHAVNAIQLAERANAAGDIAKTESFTLAAEQYAQRIIALEGELESYKMVHMQTSTAAQQAIASVKENATNLQNKLRERQQLLNQLGQARMQEKMNDAMQTLTQSVDSDVPSFDDVRAKIEARYAKARSLAELNVSTSTVGDSAMLEIESATRNYAAQNRLSQIRSELGLASPALASPAPPAAAALPPHTTQNATTAHMLPPAPAPQPETLNASQLAAGNSFADGNSQSRNEHPTAGVSQTTTQTTTEQSRTEQHTSATEQSAMASSPSDTLSDTLLSSEQPAPSSEPSEQPAPQPLSG